MLLFTEILDSYTSALKKLIESQKTVGNLNGNQRAKAEV